MLDAIRSIGLLPTIGLLALILALLGVSAYALLFTPAGDGILLGRRAKPEEKQFGSLGGDANKPNELLSSVPSWENATSKTLNSVYPVSEHFALLKLHRSLGSPIVRTGPNQVHVADTESRKVIFSQGTNYAKGKLYDLFDDAGIKNTFTMRFKTDHAPRRKLLSHAFSPASTKTVRPFIAHKLDSLLDRLNSTLEKEQDSLIDMFTAYQTLSGDITLKFAFAHDAGMVEAGRLDQMLLDIRHRTKAKAPSRRAHRALEMFPWISFIKRWLPLQVQQDIQAMRRLDSQVRSIVNSFLARGGDESEVFQKIVSAIDDTTGKSLDPEVLMVESRGLVIAGVETTAAAMTYLTWHLAKEPELYDKLLDELKTLLPSTARVGSSKPELMSNYLPDVDLVSKAPWLTALLKEVFRLYPAGARPFPRVVPEGGATFHGHYIPAGTEITCATWVQHRWDLDLWGKDAMSFRPQRWFDSDPERLVEMNRCLVPFSSGPRVCIGKNLAMDVLHMSIAAIFRNFRPSRSNDPARPGLVTKDEDMTFLGFLVAFPKGHKLEMRWEKVTE
ncbi:cytochrome P450 [Violaceomyces palustris]|uniref:Cytochrome P450 n=1 Tax=Violaceomyces palustris TaxID=1673888 RepID=A0ACD0NUE8_9BASI|nr:cytochrome P450 [Violaceomyces palustris]